MLVGGACGSAASTAPPLIAGAVESLSMYLFWRSEPASFLAKSNHNAAPMSLVNASHCAAYMQ